MTGLGALSIGAEAIVPSLYQQIVSALLLTGYPEAELKFFKIHIENDDDHAETLRDILLRHLEAEPDATLRLQAAASLVVARRRELLDSITFKFLRSTTAGEGQIHAI